ncbi:MAG: hypothetical protein U9N34_09900 [Candidatus Cloacimonadota bacterium]|nr:hypothetical protein [Candidatus Cloacimonadota bacterium]
MKKYSFVNILVFMMMLSFSGIVQADLNLIRVKGIPVANITVDGSLTDWNGLSPVYVDNVGDNGSTHAGCDLKNVYVATNASHDRLYFALEMTEQPNDEKAFNGHGTMVQYCIAFDDFNIDSYGTSYFDWQIGIDSENNYWIWDLREDKTYENAENMSWWGGNADNVHTVYRQGEIVEFSLGRSNLPLPESFAIRFYMVLRDGQNTNPDSMNYDVTLTFNPSAFKDTINSLSNHEDLLTWMKDNISYGWPGYSMEDSMTYWIYKSPDEVFFSKRGDCAAQSAFEAYILNQKGYDTRLLWVDRIDYSDHGVCYWPNASGYSYFEHAFSGHEGIHGPFNSVEDIGSDIYYKLNDGNQASYNLYDMENVVYGSDWTQFNQMLVPIVNQNWYQSTYEMVEWGNRGDDTFYCIDICDQNWNIFEGFQALECGENFHSWSPKQFLNDLGIYDGTIAGFTFNWRVWSPGGYGGNGFEGTVICK